MSISRRQALLAWAKNLAAWVIEDDYDSEFRYGLKPTDTLQSLDERGTVIYVGTFSKALSPQIRLGYLVLPKDLVTAFTHAKQLLDRHAPRLEQLVLAELIRSGAYERHIRRMRRENERRRSALLEAISRYLPSGTRVEGTSSGLHVVVWLPLLPLSSEAEIVSEALRMGIGVWPVSPLFSNASARARRPSAGLILGYGGLEIVEIHKGIKRLGAAVTDIHQRAG
jgi:GntR family transcriptional regulator/MocR family aminotransferase